MNDQHEINTAFMKVAAAWIGAMWGSVTGQGIVLTLAGVYSALQIYILFRDKLFIKDKPHDQDH